MEKKKIRFTAATKWNHFPKACVGRAFENSLRKTISYLKLAQQLGDEKSIRRCGVCQRKKSNCCYIPCHRVIGSSGEMVGYGGGIIEKNGCWRMRKGGTTGLF
jgi:O-6-methylguanine DNA methyltransferase